MDDIQNGRQAQEQELRMEDLTGKTIGGYQIIEQIGRGGMATVFRAYQPSLDRDVAIKVLPPYYAEQDETFHQRFKREARAIARLRHPNILMVMDFGEEDDLAYIVMEYVTAGTLKERMQEPLKLEEIAVLVGQISSALGYAHGQGMVHRDIKPSNIMMPKPDWALLTDFGLARMVGGSVLTQSGITVGTPAYMSPEQGSGGKVDHRTDIYSLGVMLYEMAVGEVPYTAETPMAVVVKHIVDPLPIPREKNPEVPEELQRVILKALAKSPDDRYQSVMELAAALGEVSEINPDWSATEIMAVDATRQPRVDQPETKLVEDQEDEDLAEAVTYAQPADSEAGELIQEAEIDSQKLEAEPPVLELIEDQPEGMVVEREKEEADLAEAATYVRAGDLDAERVVEEPVEGLPELEGEDAGRPERSRRWLVYFGGAVTVFVLIMIGLLVVGGIRSVQNEMNLTDNAQIQGGEADDPGSEEGLEGFPQVVELLEQGEYDQAVELAESLIRRNPDMWDPFMNVVFWLVEQGEIPRAARLLEAGLEVNPDAPPEHYIQLGWMRMEVGQGEEALAAFEEAVRKNPGLLEAHNEVIFTAIELDQAPKEIEFFSQLSGEHPEEPMIFRSLGELFLAVGDGEEAVRSYERALDLAPENPFLIARAANAYIAVGNSDVAVEMLDRAVDLAPEDHRVLGIVASFFLEMGMVERARELYELAVELDENHARNTLGLARTLFWLGEDINRIPDLLQRVERLGKEQEDPWLIAEIGWLYLEMEDCDNAVRIFEMVEEFAPGETNAQEGINECR